MAHDYAIKTTAISLPQLVEAQLQGGIRVRNEQEAYARVPLIYRAVRIRCNSLLQVPRHIYKLDNDKNPENDVETEWPFKASLDTLIWQTQAALLLRGAAFWHRLANTVRVVDLEWLNPFTVTVRWDDDTKAPQFQQNIHGETLPKENGGWWSLDDIVYFREFNVLDDVGPGVAAAGVAMQSGQLSYGIQQFASNFFNNGAMPMTLVSVLSQMDKEERERAETFFRRAMNGVANAWRVLVLGKDVKVETIQSRIRDMEAPALSDEARKEIARAFELPVTLLDQDENRATAITHQRSYYTDTVLPAAVLIQDTINRQLLEPLGLRMAFTEQEMALFQEEESNRALSLANLGTAITTMSPNQLRAAMIILGYEVPKEAEALLFAPEKPQDRQEEALAESETGQTDETVVPAASYTFAQRQEVAQFKRYAKKNKREKWDAFEFRQLTAEQAAALKQELAAPPPDTFGYDSPAHKAHMGHYESQINRLMGRVGDVVRNEMGHQATAMVHHVRGTNAKAAPTLPSQAEYNARLQELIIPVLRSILAEGGQDALDALHLGIAFDVTNPKVNDALMKQVQMFVQRVNDTTWQRLKDELQAGYDAGEGVDELARRVEDVMQERIRSSGETIARTETARAYNAGTVDAWRESGVVKGKKWLATLDNRVRPDHLAVHGQTVGIDDPFDVGGEELDFPGDPQGSAENTVNCRCACVAVLD